MSNQHPIEVDHATGKVKTIHPKRYRCRLDTMQNVRSEMSRVYREARSGLLDIQEASRLTYMLSGIGKVLMDSEIEARIEVLEAAKK